MIWLVTARLPSRAAGSELDTILAATPSKRTAMGPAKARSTGALLCASVALQDVQVATTGTRPDSVPVTTLSPSMVKTFGFGVAKVSPRAVFTRTRWPSERTAEASTAATRPSPSSFSAIVAVAVAVRRRSYPAPTLGIASEKAVARNRSRPSTVTGTSASTVMAAYRHHIRTESMGGGREILRQPRLE